MKIVLTPIYPKMPNVFEMPVVSVILIIKYVLFISVFALLTWILSARMKEMKFKCNKCLNVSVSVIVSFLMLYSYGFNMTAIKGMLLLYVLLFASCSDLTTRTVDDNVFVMILIISLINFNVANLLSMLIGAFVVFVPQVAIAVINPDKAIGGADIKITTSIAFLLGVYKGVMALLIGLMIAIIYNVIKSKMKKQKIDSFALVPFIAIGSILTYLI